MFVALVLALAPFPGAGTHPESLSRSRVTVTGSEARVELHFQTLSLIETQPALDRTGDLTLDEAELEAGRTELERYLLGDFLVFGDGGGLIPGEVERIALLPGKENDLQWMDATLTYRSPTALIEFEIESRLFRETNPWHRDLCTVSWNGEGDVRHLFEGDDIRWRFEPAAVRRPGVLATFVRLGIEHILAGFDHLAFLVALLVASRRIKALIGVVTAFTLAHSITLALAATGKIDLPSRFVELAIALSIAYVACDNLLRKDARNPWIEAFGFGLLHGLGFAGFLGEALEGENLIITALLGFNLGVELGQLAVVIVCVTVLWVAFARWRRTRPAGEPPALAPRWFRMGASAVVALMGFYWFLERAGWLP